jgi:hypothetical protein
MGKPRGIDRNPLLVKAKLREVATGKALYCGTAGD